MCWFCAIGLNPSTRQDKYHCAHFSEVETERQWLGNLAHVLQGASTYGNVSGTFA